MVSVIIVAGGKGLRMGDNIPKQFIPIGGLPILMQTIVKFYNHPRISEVVVVLPFDHLNYWNELCVEYSFNIPYKIAFGGATRFESVKNGLSDVDVKSKYIFVQDAVRPFVSDGLIDSLVDEVIKHGAVIPATEMVDSVRQVDENGESIVMDRTRLKLVQTPQAFERDILFKAYDLPYDSQFTDDASVVEKSGVSVSIIDGDINNFKITTQKDLLLAKSILASL